MNKTTMEILTIGQHVHFQQVSTVYTIACFFKDAFFNYGIMAACTCRDGGLLLCSITFLNGVVAVHHQQRVKRERRTLFN